MKSTESWKTEYNEESKTIDVVINKGIVLTTDIEKIRLRLQNKLTLFYEEWFLHENEGLNWLNTNAITGQIGRMLADFNIESQVKLTILSDNDVEDLQEFTSNFDNQSGKYTFDCKVKLKDGTVLTF